VAKDPARRGELEGFLYRLLEAVRVVAVLASPVMPGACARIHAMLGLGEREPGPEDLAWGRLTPGQPLGAIAPLFPRVEKEDLAAEAAAGPVATTETTETTASAAKKARLPKRKEPPVPEMTPPPDAGEKPATPAAAAATPAATPAGALPAAGERIDISDFAKVELRAARVTAAEKIAGSKKLVKLQVELGSESRQVVAGIAESYAPEVLVGKTVVLVVNLKPAKLMGVESNGMVLAGSIDGKAVLCTFDAEVAPGTKVK
jgi:methionyl-tRNA synthetase